MRRRDEILQTILFGKYKNMFTYVWLNCCTNGCHIIRLASARSIVILFFLQVKKQPSTVRRIQCFMLSRTIFSPVRFVARGNTIIIHRGHRPIDRHGQFDGIAIWSRRRRFTRQQPTSNRVIYIHRKVVPIVIKDGRWRERKKTQSINNYINIILRYKKKITLLYNVICCRFCTYTHAFKFLNIYVYILKTRCTNKKKCLTS